MCFLFLYVCVLGFYRVPKLGSKTAFHQHILGRRCSASAFLCHSHTPRPPGSKAIVVGRPQSQNFFPPTALFALPTPLSLPPPFFASSFISCTTPLPTTHLFYLYKSWNTPIIQLHNLYESTLVWIATCPFPLPHFAPFPQVERNRREEIKVWNSPVLLSIANKNFPTIAVSLHRFKATGSHEAKVPSGVD